MSRRHFLDWRLVAALAALVLVAFVLWNGVDANRRADVAIATLQQHDHDAAQDRTSAAQDRATAAENQKALLDYVRALAAQQAAENAWLRAHHIPIPQRLITVIRPPRIVVRHHHRAGHHVRRHRSTSSSSSTPPGPGKSGGAPGHRKHRPRHR